MNTDNIATAHPFRHTDAERIKEELTAGKWVWYKPFFRSYEIIPNEGGTDYDIHDTDGYVSYWNTMEQVMNFVTEYKMDSLNDFE